MPKTPSKAKGKVDLSKASPKELNKIQNEVTRRLAAAVQSGETKLAKYDKHTSSHSRNTLA